MVPSILRFYQIMNAELLPTQQDQSVVKKKKSNFFLADEKHENKNHSEATVVMN